MYLEHGRDSGLCSGSALRQGVLRQTQQRDRESQFTPEGLKIRTWFRWSWFWFGLVRHLSFCLFQAEEMINAIRSAFKEGLDRLSWMDDHTRQAAKEKVERQVDRQVHRQVDRQVLIVLCLFILR